MITVQIEDYIALCKMFYGLFRGKIIRQPNIFNFLLFTEVGKFIGSLSNKTNFKTKIVFESLDQLFILLMKSDQSDIRDYNRSSLSGKTLPGCFYTAVLDDIVIMYGNVVPGRKKGSIAFGRNDIQTGMFN